MPRRLQRKRSKGWTLPPDAKCVTRPGRWGNPLVGDRAGAWFRVWLHNPRSTLAEVLTCASYRGCQLRIHLAYERWRYRKAAEYLTDIEVLRGFDLLCWCAVGQGEECHAFALIEAANREESK